MTAPPADIPKEYIEPYPAGQQSGLASFAFLVALGWLGTNLGLAIGEFPLKILIKENLHQSADSVAAFFAIGQFTNYIKPVAGILTDSVPLFRTRRRWYLLLSLLGTGLAWIVLSVVPRDYHTMLITYTILYTTVMFTSTTLGGVMVEGGMRYGAAGRLTAQRIAMFRLGTFAGGPIAGWLANYPFLWAAGAAAALHLMLVPLYYKALPEAPTARLDTAVWKRAFENLQKLVRSRVVFAAAGMILLIAASPGFNTPLLYQQRDNLHFSTQFIGMLVLIGSGTGLLAAIFYHAVCKTWNLRLLLAISIIIHALGTLTYLWYHSHTSAVLITALSGISGTLAVLPVYDLAFRGTPRGCEALGYAVMMSVWNLTNALSDWTGSRLYSKFHLTFMHLVWVNTGTTALVLLAVPFLPAALILRKDGMPAQNLPQGETQVPVLEARPPA